MAIVKHIIGFCLNTQHYLFAGQNKTRIKSGLFNSNCQTRDIGKEEELHYALKTTTAGNEKLFEITVPPQKKTSVDIEKILTNSKTPPYNEYFKDGVLSGLYVMGEGLQKCAYGINMIKRLGYSDPVKTGEVNIEDKLNELLISKDGKEPEIDYLVKAAHANGYDFDAGVFRSNKKVKYYVFEKVENKKNKRIHLLCQPETLDEEINISYDIFFNSIKLRTIPLLEANLSCSSVSKAAYELNVIGDLCKLTELCSNDAVNYCTGEYFPDTDFDTYLAPNILRGLDSQWSYDEIRQSMSKDISKMILLPDDPKWKESILSYSKMLQIFGENGKKVKLEEVKEKK